MVLIGEILAHAARHDTGRDRGDPRRRRDHVRRDRRRREPQSRTAWPAPGIGRGDRVLWWGDTSLEAVPVFACAREARRGVRAAERARRRSTRCVPVAEYARPRLLARDAAHRDAAAELAAPPASRSLDRDPGRRRRLRRACRSSTNATRTSSSSRAAAPDGRRVSSCRTARTGCGRIPVRRRPRAARGTVCMFPLFHMAGWTIALGAWQGRRPIHFVRVPDAATLLRHDGPAPRRPPLLHPSGLGAHPRALSVARTTSRAWSRPTPARRRRHRSCCTRSRTRCRAPSRACSTAPPKPGPGVQLGDADLLRKPGSVGVPQAGVDLQLTDVRRGVPAQPVPHGRLLRRARGDGRGRCATAGTTPVISARSTTRASSRSSAARATSSAPAARRSRRPRSSRCSLEHPAIARSRDRRAFPIRSGARS